jgi:putative ABC transport system permease protein
MMLAALKMLRHNKGRFTFSVLGLAGLFLLSAAQVGLLVGWCNTITGVMAHAGADVWVMGEGTRAWEYGISLPRQRIYQTRNVQGVAQAEGIYVGWSRWQRPDGQQLSVQMVGLDVNSVGGPWRLVEGRVQDVHLPNSVIIDELFLSALGVKWVGDEVELYGTKATVRGISRGVRTFTASPILFTSMKTAAKYDKTYRRGDTTFVLVKCAPGCSPRQVATAIRATVPGVEALTSDELMTKSILYWLRETGIGLIVLITATLGVVVSAVVTSQTLYNITQDHLSNYATLLAIGFNRGQLAACVLAQGLVLSGLAILIGGLAFQATSVASADTAAPLEMTSTVFAALAAVSLLSCLLGSFLSLRKIFHIDPVAVFRG